MISGVVFLETAGLLQEIGLSGLISSLHEIFLAFPIIFLFLGVTYCFLGRVVFDAYNFLIGGFIALGFAVSLLGLSGTGMIIASLASFLLGGLIGFFTPYVFVALVGFSIGVRLFFAFSSLVVASSPIFGLISGIVLALIAVLLFRFYLPLLTALLGGFLAAYAFFDWTGSEPFSLVIGILLIAAGAIFQYTFLEPHERE